jgi:chromosomal replication initiator protein
MNQFRQKYRNVDCLLIDDIQFLVNKESSQEEFFYTFNTLYDSRKQIVISSDRPPKEIPTLQERLITRFEWGVVADIQAPDLETRIAILREKAEAEHLYVPDDVILFLASHIRTNIRELEGSLIRVVAHASLTGVSLTVDSAKETLRDVIAREEASAPVSVEKVQEIVAKHYHVDLHDMKSKRRTDAIAFPRQIAMYLARTLTDMSTTQIGDAFGGKDHTTVMHATTKIKNKLESDPFFAALVNKIIQEIKLGIKSG